MLGEPCKAQPARAHHCPIFTPSFVPVKSHKHHQYLFLFLSFFFAKEKRRNKTSKISRRRRGRKRKKTIEPAYIFDATIIQASQKLPCALPTQKFALVTAHLVPYTKSQRFVASGLGYASWFLFCYRLNVISYRAMKCVRMMLLTPRPPPYVVANK